MNILDRVILVDETDHPIGVMDKYEAHRNGAQLHRAVSVYLFAKLDGQLQLLIQKRSAQKIVGAGMWANTICGNVRPGESYRECAYRRLREELGLKNSVVDSCDLQAVHKFSYFVKCNEEFSEREIDQVFVGFVESVDYSTFQKSLIPNPNEVAEIDWLPYQNLVETARKNNWQPDSDHFLQNRNNERVGNDERVGNNERVGSNKRVGNNEQVRSNKQVAPWFIIMLRDQEIVKSIFDLLQNHV
jgi:isopentenyl-diphosphate delta-isomerase